MNGNLKYIFADKGIKYAFFGSVLILIIEVFFISFFFSKFPPLIPLFNSLSWGKDRLAVSQFIFIIPVFLFLITMINIAFASVSYKKNALLSRMVAINLLLTVVLSLVALVQIFLLIF